MRVCVVCVCVGALTDTALSAALQRATKENNKYGINAVVINNHNIIKKIYIIIINTQWI